MQIVRKSSFTATPWKNGGGVTHEIIRVPPGGSAFRWRLSVAQIETSGPFSDFAGYSRTMVLLRGDGIRLTFDGGRRAVLDAVGDVVEFDGALATGCELLGGPCTDLNLMVSRSVRAVAGVQRLHQPHFVHSSSHGTTLVFGISGTLAIECGKGGLTTLAAGEAAVMAPQDHGTISPAVDQCAAPLVFFAALDDT